MSNADITSKIVDIINHFFEDDLKTSNNAPNNIIINDQPDQFENEELINEFDEDNFHDDQKIEFIDEIKFDIKDDLSDDFKKYIKDNFQDDLEYFLDNSLKDILNDNNFYKYTQEPNIQFGDFNNDTNRDNSGNNINKKPIPIIKRRNAITESSIEDIIKTFKSPNYDNLDNNQKNENTIYCDECPFYTNDNICMMDHKLIYHDGIFNEYVCDNCAAYFPTMSELDNHIFISHTKKKDSHDSSPIAKRKSTKIEKIDCCKNNDTTNTIQDNSEKNFDDEFDDDSDNDSDYNSENDEINNNNDTEHKNLYKWSCETGKYECNICKLKFRSQNYLGEHFMLNHQSYEDQLELDKQLNISSFPGFEVLIENSYCVIDDIKKHYDNTCEICYEKYLIGHDTQIKSISSMFLENYEGTTLYPIIINCCNTNHCCHKCVSQYLSSNHLKGLLICPFCQHDRSRYDVKYLSIHDISCNKHEWQQWWQQNDRHYILSSSRHGL